MTTLYKGKENKLFDIVEGLAVLDESFKTGKIEQNSAIWNAVFEVMLI